MRRFMPVIDAMLGAGGALRFITLTVVDGPDLAERVRHLERSFRKLKQQKLWRRCVEGGIRVLEIKRGERSGLWHPHYHLLVTGNYIPQRELAVAWKKATGDSGIVHVCFAGANVVKELFKYTVKDAGLTPGDLDEAARVLKGKRVVAVLGLFYNRQVPLAEAGEQPRCEVCGGQSWLPEDVFMGRCVRVLRE